MRKEMRFRLSVLVRCALVAAPIAMAACNQFDLFEEKKTPLAGERKPLFPAGVPGVNYNEPPQQPTNSNIPVNTEISGKSLGREQPPPAEENEPRGKSRTARNATKNGPAPADQPAANDPWADSRNAN
jgi:hypothetical protein